MQRRGGDDIDDFVLVESASEESDSASERKHPPKRKADKLIKLREKKKKPRPNDEMEHIQLRAPEAQAACFWASFVKFMESARNGLSDLEKTEPLVASNFVQISDFADPDSHSLERIGEHGEYLQTSDLA